jgi:Protein of unknown function (DUF2924)
LPFQAKPSASFQLQAFTRSRWHTAFGRPPPPHLSRHLLFRTLAYGLQADRWGDLDSESRRLLDRSGSPEQAGKRAIELSRRTAAIRPGTLLSREWNGRMQRVAVQRLIEQQDARSGDEHSRERHPLLLASRSAILRRWRSPKASAPTRGSIMERSGAPAAIG